jgi:sulfate permease, SulP family
MQRIKNFFLPFGGNISADTLSGLTVALALVPEAIAFALVAHVSPLVGLYSAFFMCLITAVIGGRPGMISGATGSMAVVIVALVSQFGIEYLFATIVLTGIFQLLIGIAKLGKFIRILPRSVMVGFVNGLAIVIFIAQLQQFKIHTGNTTQWLTGGPLYLMLGLVIVAMAIIYLLPKLTTRLPSALVAIIAITLCVHFLHIDTRVVDDMMGGQHISSAGLPTFALITVPLNLATLKIVLPYAVVLCIIGLSESLMTLSLIDEITQTRGKANKECIAQGISNIVCGFFKGMGGCVMIGQSMININSGGRGRLSGIVAGIALLLFIVVLWPIIKVIPLAALVGVMFIVVIKTFEWTTFSFIGKIPKHDAFIIISVTLITVFTNLAIATITGVIIAALVFSWQTAKHIYADKSINEKNQKEYKLHGPLFFGSTATFKTLFDIDKDPNDVVIDFMHARVADHSAIEAIQSVGQRYATLGKTLHLRHLSAECKLLLGKAGDMVEVNFIEDPDYRVASDELG